MLENTHPEQVADEHMIFWVDKWNPQERSNMSHPFGMKLSSDDEN